MILITPIFTFSDGSFMHLSEVKSAHVTLGNYDQSLDKFFPPCLCVSGHPNIEHKSNEAANSELKALNNAVVAWHCRPKLSGLIPMPDGSSLDLSTVARIAPGKNFGYHALWITYTNGCKDAFVCESVEEAEAETESAIALWETWKQQR